MQKVAEIVGISSANLQGNIWRMALNEEGEVVEEEMLSDYLISKLYQPRHELCDAF